MARAAAGHFRPPEEHLWRATLSGFCASLVGAAVLALALTVDLLVPSTPETGRHAK